MKDEEASASHSSVLGKELFNRFTVAPLADRISKLRELFPEITLEGQFDLDKLKELLGLDGEPEAERYTFSWAGKREAIRLLQAPSGASLYPDENKSIEFESTTNAIIEGDNLETLKLLYKPYFGRIKMIYIDPPYNTGNDFIYPDSFANSLDTYLTITGQKDATGNYNSSADVMDAGRNLARSGSYHSAWLSMMYPRLFLARQLLKENGVIFVSIDDHEVHNLRLLMNEIFGEENFLATLVWQKKYGPANDAKQFSQTHEYLIAYARNATLWTPNLFERNEEQLAAYKNPDNDARGPWRASDLSARTASESGMYPIQTPSGRVVHPPASRSWIVSEQRFQELLDDNRITFGIDGNGRPMQKKFLSEVKQGITPQTWWDRDFAGDNKSARYELKEIFPENVFDTPKPTSLIRRLLEISTTPDTNDIVLDFFAGSGTTADAVLGLNKEDGGNRSFILIQLPEPTGNKGLRTIADLCVERVRRIITREAEAKNPKLPLDKNKAPLSPGFKVFRLAASNFRPWDVELADSPEKYIEQMGLFLDPLMDGWKVINVIYEVAIKEGLGLNIQYEPISLDEACTIYKVFDNERRQTFYICLDSALPADLYRKVPFSNNDLFICRDVALTDEIAANMALQCRIKTL